MSATKRYVENLLKEIDDIDVDEDLIGDAANFKEPTSYQDPMDQLDLSSSDDEDFDMEEEIPEELAKPLNVEDSPIRKPPSPVKQIKTPNGELIDDPIEEFEETDNKNSKDNITNIKDSIEGEEMSESGNLMYRSMSSRIKVDMDSNGKKVGESSKTKVNDKNETPKKARGRSKSPSITKTDKKRSESPKTIKKRSKSPKTKREKNKSKSPPKKSKTTAKRKQTTKKPTKSKQKPKKKVTNNDNVKLKTKSQVKAKPKKVTGKRKKREIVDEEETMTHLEWVCKYINKVPQKTMVAWTKKYSNPESKDVTISLDKVTSAQFKKAANNKLYFVLVNDILNNVNKYKEIQPPKPKKAKKK